VWGRIGDVLLEPMQKALIDAKRDAKSIGPGEIVVPFKAIRNIARPDRLGTLNGRLVQNFIGEILASPNGDAPFEVHYHTERDNWSLILHNPTTRQIERVVIAWDKERNHYQVVTAFVCWEGMVQAHDAVIVVPAQAKASAVGMPETPPKVVIRTDADDAMRVLKMMKGCVQELMDILHKLESAFEHHERCVADMKSKLSASEDDLEHPIALKEGSKREANKLEERLFRALKLFRQLQISARDLRTRLADKADEASVTAHAQLGRCLQAEQEFCDLRFAVCDTMFKMASTQTDLIESALEVSLPNLQHTASNIIKEGSKLAAMFKKPGDNRFRDSLDRKRLQSRAKFLPVLDDIIKIVENHRSQIEFFRQCVYSHTRTWLTLAEEFPDWGRRSHIQKKLTEIRMGRDRHLRLLEGCEPLALVEIHNSICAGRKKL